MPGRRFSKIYSGAASSYKGSFKGSVRGSVRSSQKSSNRNGRVQLISDFDSDSEESMAGMSEIEMNKINSNIQELEKQQLVDMNSLEEFDSLNLKKGEYKFEKEVIEQMKNLHS